MDPALEAAVRSFLARHADADLVEAVVDTSVDGPYLNLWAWRLHAGSALDDALAQVTASGDGGYLADIVDELGSSTFAITLAGLYPDWPVIAHGDQAVLRILHAAATPLSPRTRLIFHHVDAWPAVTIR